MVHHISPLIVNNHVPCIPRSVHAVPLCDGGSPRLDVIDWFAGWLVTHNNSSDNTMLMAVGVWSGWWALIDSYKTNLRNSDWNFYMHAGPSSSLIPYPFRLFVQVYSKVLSVWNWDYYGMSNKITEFVQCEAVQFGRSVTTFQKNLLPTPFKLKKSLLLSSYREQAAVLRLPASTILYEALYSRRSQSWNMLLLLMMIIMISNVLSSRSQ